MSDVESSAAARKRLRSDSPAGPSNGNAEDEDDIGPSMPAPGADDSDDEIGPMPTAAGDDVVVSNGRRKKRAGELLLAPAFGMVADRRVLPHEKLFLDHLPDQDRYYKSFMHRDTVNFVTMTK